MQQTILIDEKRKAYIYIKKYQEEAFDKAQYNFILKTCNKLLLEKNFLNLANWIC